MSLLIEKTGLLATIQDAGRNKFRRFGINPNGAMDAAARRLINILLGNGETEAVVEMHFPAPEFRFEKAAVFALGGADFGAILNGELLENHRAYFAESGSILKFARKNSGNRCYLAVAGGFALEKWLGSFSTNLAAHVGGFEGRSLKKNDRLFFSEKTNRAAQISRAQISNSLIPRYTASPTLRIIKGADFDDLNAISGQRFSGEKFVVGKDSNRMGFRLNGAPLFLLDETERISTAVDFGTIQLLPDGQMIVLMADHQTTGGYPRLGNVISIDLPLVAQCGAGDAIGFSVISIEEAEKIFTEYEKELNWLKIGCQLAQKR